MKRRVKRLAVLGLLTVLCAGGCSLQRLVGARIEVRGGPLTIEEQVLGTFERLGEEVYLLAGVRSIDPVTGSPSAPPPMTASEARALAARRRMEFNRDDVSAFKRPGYVGEGREGLLVVFEGELEALRSADPRRFRLVQEVVAEENEDRLAVMRRIVETTPELRGEEGMAAVARILAAKGRQEAEPGARVQLPDGAWITLEERP